MGNGQDCADKLTVRRRFLVVEDDRVAARALRKLLELQGHSVEVAYTGAQGASMLKFDLSLEFLLLDLKLPDLSGLDVLLQMKNNGVRLPTIVVSASLDPKVKSRALHLGADDFISKPFDPDELLARIGAVLRRTPAPEKLTGVDLRLRERAVVIRGESKRLSRRETAILTSLAERRGQIVTRESLAGDSSVTALDQHVHNLRKRFGPAARCIETVHSVGFRLNLPERCIDILRER